MSEQNRLTYSTVKKSSQFYSTPKELLFASSVVTKSLLAPFERIMISMQCQTELMKNGCLKQPFKDVASCAKILNKEGLVSFWRGNLANVINVIPTQSLGFFFYFIVKDAQKEARIKESLATNIGAGAISGIATAHFTYSLDFVRTRLAADIRPSSVPYHQFSGIKDVYSKIYASDGVKGLYRGFSVGIFGVVLYRAFFLGMYETLKPLFFNSSEMTYSSYIGLISLTWGIKIATNFLTYPIDTLKKRIMMDAGEPVKYKNSLICVKEMFQKEGIRSFYKGMSMNVFNSLSTVLLFVGLESAYNIYKENRKSSRNIFPRGDEDENEL